MRWARAAEPRGWAGPSSPPLLSWRCHHLRSRLFIRLTPSGSASSSALPPLHEVIRQTSRQCHRDTIPLMSPQKPLLHSCVRKNILRLPFFISKL